MNIVNRLREERGVALIVVLFVALLIGALSAGATLMTSSASLVQRYSDQMSVLNAAADAGLEEVRSQINGNKVLFPDSGFATLENGSDVYDADGSQIPGVKRWLYVGPSGVTTGQYGVFGSIVSVVEDKTGNRVVRRTEVAQESFAKYAYFTDVEPANISFGNGDQIQGPVHSNDYLKIYSSGASFLGTVTTAKTVNGKQYGRFARGYEEFVSRIELPETADLTKLQSQAALGGTAFTGDGTGGEGEASLRLEFYPLDIDGDGQFNGNNEGFIRVYRSPNTQWVVAHTPNGDNGGLQQSGNCGHEHADGSFYPANASVHNPGTVGDQWQDAVTSGQPRCYLGGSDILFNTFRADDGLGKWIPWPGAKAPEVIAAVVAAGSPADLANYLFPINRQFNPTFKGVIFVEGKVAISGVLRGRVTVAATDDIIIADDITYVTNPGAGVCNDILGIFSGADVVVSDNTINSPTRPAPNAQHRSYDDTPSEFIHGVVLALGIFTVDNYTGGSNHDEPCEATVWGRGCLYLTGGVIQHTRGAVGLSSRYGYLKRYSYDQCAYTNPPPYFPTTGHFEKGRYFEIDPVGFDVNAYWRLLTPSS